MVHSTKSSPHLFFFFLSPLPSTFFLSPCSPFFCEQTLFLMKEEKNGALGNLFFFPFHCTGKKLLSLFFFKKKRAPSQDQGSGTPHLQRMIFCEKNYFFGGGCQCNEFKKLCSISSEKKEREIMSFSLHAQ